MDTVMTETNHDIDTNIQSDKFAMASHCSSGSTEDNGQKWEGSSGIDSGYTSITDECDTPVASIE